MNELSLQNTFRKGFKNPSEYKVGIEWEKIGVYADSCQAIPYEGKRGVEAIFKLLIRDCGWKSASEKGGRPIALKKSGASITLEPGGQIELSGQKQSRLKDNFQELSSHLDQIKRISNPLGIAWLGIGAHPVSSLGAIPWVPKERYAIMRRTLKAKGSLTHSMMKETASIQISVDYSDEGDAIEKLRLAMALAPFLTGIFANSPLHKGQLSSYLSRRSHIWRHTAPERTGLMEWVFEKNAGFKDYVRYAFSVPLLFIIRDGRWVTVKKRNFGQFLKTGFGAWNAVAADWDLHLSTLFTEARLKTYLEIRSVDCQSAPLCFSAPALIKGIFYGGGAVKATWDRIGGGKARDYQDLLVDAARHGLRARWRRETIWSVAKDLIRIAESGLSGDEKKYLRPLKELVIQKRKTPAEDLLDRMRQLGSSLPQKEKIIRCAKL